MSSQNININNNDKNENVESFKENIENNNSNLKETINNDKDKSIDNNINKNKSSNINEIKSDDINISVLNKNDIENNIQNNSINLSQIRNPIYEQLIEFGYNPIYSKRIIQYFHPRDVEEALDYLSINQGVINHRFIKDRNINNITCYVCGEKKEIHLDYNPENLLGEINISNIKSNSINNINNDEINIKNSINLEVIKNDDISEIKEQKKCEICSESFIPKNENTLKQCGHSYCNSCWYDFLSAQIQENKLPSIKCLNYECQEKLTDEFIINLLKNNNDLIEKYKKYKYELEIINNPNKKICPFPNCDSYLELKDPRIKEVTCLNNHTFCFLCLRKPHGKIPCNENLDTSMIEFAKNNFVKRCPKCGIITEKSSGCNHITCSKCRFQWCWLCNGEYTYDHYIIGKCKGFQFFKPSDENEIQLAFEGKIELRESQRQEDYQYDEYTDNNNLHERHLPRLRRFHINMNENEYIERYNCLGTFIILFLYIMIGHGFYSLISMKNEFMINNLVIILVCISYFFLEVANFFPMIFFNLIMLIPYLTTQGFYRFIYYCTKIGRYTNLTKIFYQCLLIILNIFFGGFFHMQFIRYKIYLYNKFEKTIFVLISCIFEVIFFPLQLFTNQLVILKLLIFDHSNVLTEMDKVFEKGIGFSFINNE